MHTRTTTAAGLLAAGLLLTACSSGGSDDKATATPSSTPPPAAATTSPPAPTPSPTPTAYAIGHTWDWTGDQTSTVHGTSTVLAYEQPAKTSAPSPKDALGSTFAGYVWADADVKVCSKDGEGFTASNEPWVLAYADGARVSPSDTTYEGFPQPEFPMGDAPLTPGQCVRGKIVFAVPGKSRPVVVMYAPDGIGEPGMWLVPAK